MISAQLYSLVQQKLSEKFGSINKDLNFSPIGGGCINEPYCISWPEHKVFCKINSATKFPRLFEKEKNGLEFIQGRNIIKTPAVIESFEAAGHQILLLEWIDEGERTDEFWKKFGEQLATLHQITTECFGFAEDNYMGSVPQKNKQETTWIKFFISQRLHPLSLECAEQKLLSRVHLDQLEKLYRELPNIFDTHSPALLHGDLWSGNFMCNKNSEPVLIDPAVYFGHPAVDLGMTRLFGGFGSGFYEAYHYHSPFPKNHEDQWTVCNLYPLLIHLLLFGRSYLSQIERTLGKFS